MKIDEQKFGNVAMKYIRNSLLCSVVVRCFLSDRVDYRSYIIERPKSSTEHTYLKYNWNGFMNS